jgi:uncharacterized membrane protein YgaE (UPF0421/DUF939 family)
MRFATSFVPKLISAGRSVIEVVLAPVSSKLAGAVVLTSTGLSVVVVLASMARMLDGVVVVGAFVVGVGEAIIGAGVVPDVVVEEGEEVVGNFSASQKTYVQQLYQLLGKQMQ